MGDYVPNSLEPQTDDSVITLLRKLTALLNGARDGTYPLQISGISGGGGGAGAMHVAATTLAGHKAITTVATYVVRDLIWVHYEATEPSPGLWVLRSGVLSDDVTYVRPDDAANRYWERIL